MADRRLSLAVDFVGNDKLSSTVVAMGRVSAEAQQRIGGLKRQVDTLNRSMADARALRAATESLKKNRSAAKDAAAELARLKAQIVAGTPPTNQLVRSIQAAERNLTKMQAAEKKASDTARTMVSNFRAAGVDVARLGVYEQQTATRIEHANRALEHQQTVLRGNRQRMAELGREERARDRQSGGRSGRVRPGSSPVDEDAPGQGGRPGIDPSHIHSVATKTLTVLEMANEAADVGAEVQALKYRLRGLGLSQRAADDLEDFAKNMRISGVSVREGMRYLVESQGAFRESGEHNPEEQVKGAKLMAPIMAKLMVTSKSLGKELSPDQEQYFLRFIEQRGGTNNPKTGAVTADGLFRALMSSGGTVDPANYQTFMSAAGVSGMHLTPQALYADFEPLIAELHQGAGVGLMKAFTRANGNVQNQPAMREFIRLGAWDRSKVVFNKVDGIKQLKGNPLRADLAEQLATSPVDFYKSIQKLYAAKGIKGKEIDRENLLLFGGTGGKLFSEMQQKMQTIDRSRGAYAQTMGLDDSYKMVSEGLMGQREALHAATDDFNLQLAEGSGAVDFFTRTLKAATDFLHGGVFHLRHDDGGKAPAQAAPNAWPFNLPARPISWSAVDLSHLGNMPFRPGISAMPSVPSPAMLQPQPPLRAPLSVPAGMLQARPRQGIAPQRPPLSPVVSMPQPRITVAAPMAGQRAPQARGAGPDWSKVNLSNMGGAYALPSSREPAKPMAPIAINLRLPAPPPPAPKPDGPITIVIQAPPGATPEQMADLAVRRLKQEQARQRGSTYNGGR